MVCLAAGAVWLWARPAGPEGVTILGVRPGMTRAQVDDVLGTGQLLHDAEGVLTVGYGAAARPGTDPPPGSRWAHVVFTSDGFTSDVRGSHLLRDGVQVLALGEPGTAAEAALGPAPRSLVSGHFEYPDLHNLQVFALQGRVEMLWMSWREGPKGASPTPAPPLDRKSVTTPGWSILGARPGMTRAQVEALLGPGRQVDLAHGNPTLAYGDFEGRTTWVDIFYEGDRASTLRGSHLYRDGRLVLAPGSAPAPLGSGEPMEMPRDGGEWRMWHESGAGYLEKGGRVESVYLQPTLAELEKMLR